MRASLPRTPLFDDFATHWPSDPANRTFFGDLIYRRISGFTTVPNKATPSKLLTAHRRGMMIWSWTIDDEASWEQGLRDGHDGMYSNDPATLLKYIKSKREKCGFVH